MGLLTLFVVAHFAHHLLTAIPVPLLPMIRNEFDLDYTKSGLVASAFSLAYGFGQLPAGWLADRIGARLLLTTGVCGVALAGLLVGISHLYAVLLVGLAIMGVLGGGYHPSAPPIISASVAPGNRGRALGLHMIGGSASFFLAPIIATAIASAWGWRVSFLGLAFPTLIFGAVFYVLLGRASGHNPEHAKPTSGVDQSEPATQPGSLWAFMFLSIFTGALFNAVISFIPLYLVDHFQVRAERAGALLGILYSAGLWVGPLAGYLSDKVGRVRMMLVVCAVGGMVILVFTSVPYGWPFLVLLMSMGLIIYVRMPVSEAYIVGRTPLHRRSTVLGLYYFGSMEGGGVLTPVVGYLVDRFGFSFSFAVSGAALVLVTLGCAVTLWGRRE